MPPGRRAWGAALGVAAAVGAGLAIDALSREPALPILRLGNGAALRVLGVTYGTEHRIHEGTGWQRLALRALPPPSRVPRYFGAPSGPSNIFKEPGRLGGWQLATTTPEEKLVVWLRASGGARAWYQPRITGRDEHGCPFPCEPRWVATGPLGAETLGLVEFSSFPRRTGGLRLAADGGPGGAVEATIGVPNLGRYPTWQASPLPARQQRGDLTFSLTGWAAGRPVPAAAFEVRRGGVVIQDWEPVTLTVSDATGNSSTTARETDFLPDPRLMSLRPLCLRESAWKLRVEFMPSLPPRPPGGPVPDWSLAPKVEPWLRWTAEAAAPAAGTAPQSATLDTSGLVLKVRKTSLPGELASVEDTERRLRCPAVRVAVEGLKEPVRITLDRVTDDRGRTAAPRWRESPLERPWDPVLPRPSHLFRPPGQERYFVLPSLPGAKRLRLAFVVHRAAVVEFVVAPPGGP